MKYLFMITIGPVQSFIGNSRKARDLFGGSMMLSELMQESACWLEKQEHVNILFPVRQQGERFPNIPNRLIAEVKDCSEEQLRMKAETLSKYIRQRWIETGLDLLKKVGIGEDGCCMAEAQLEDYLEIYWLYEPCEQDYREAYEKLFAAIHDVKNIRKFKQTREPWGRKCALFPEYGAIFAKRKQSAGRAIFPYNTNPRYVCDISYNPKLRYAVKENEALCAMALVKRIYGREQTAIYSVRQMMLRSRVKPEVLKRVKDPEADYNLWDDISDIVYDLKNENDLTDEVYTEAAIRCAKELYQWIEKDKIALSSYYALIKFDGDSMGEQFKCLRTSKEQQALSRHISDFAYLAPKVLLKYGGLPVYAGGEDFLGYVPLDGLFDCMKELHEHFLEMVGVTFSAGIVVAHLMQPMKEVVMLADQMEHEAKNKEGKNAFAIGILKRNGEFVDMPACHFTAQGGEVGLDNVKTLVSLLTLSGCSKSLFFQINRELDYFVRKEVCPPQMLVEVLLKKCVAAALLDDAKINKEQMLQELMMLFNSSKNVRDFLSILNGIVFLSREVDGCYMN